MGKNKGCINELCEAYKKETTYKDSEMFCSKCGSPLVYVCKKCHRQLPDNKEKLCVRCRAEIEDRRKKNQNVAGKAVGYVIAGGVLLINVADKLKNTKKE